MSTEQDPLGISGTMIGQFRVGSAMADAPSGWRYTGRDLHRVNGNVPAAVWLQFFGPHASAELVRAQAGAWLGYKHRAFVPLIGHETEENQRTLVATEAGDGVLLRRRLLAGPMPTVEVAKLALLLCELLVDAHQRGLVHLGLCTESILVPQHGSGGPQLFGIGLLKGFDQNQLETYQFLAPEQISSSPCDQRADIYALGVVMFRCATGQFPDEVTGPGVEAARLASRHSRDLHRWLSGEAEALTSIIERCIRTDPTDRFQTSSALAEAIRHSGLLQGGPRSDRANITLPPPATQEPEKRASIDQTTLPPTVPRASPNQQQPMVEPARQLAGKDDLVGQRVKDLLIEKLLEETASSRIYVAKHTRLPRSWVVKVAKGRRRDAAKCFEQEARVTAALRERGQRVAEVPDWDTFPDGRPYLVMELVEGRTLDKVLKTNPMLPVDDCLEIINSICQTLENAHDLGFLHRDIKPANIMLQERYGCQTGGVVVLDWGMARGSGDARILITKEGTILGTAGYRAPEAPMRVDGRADTFSVATILYEMLAGKRAFEGADDASLSIAVNTYYPAPLSTIRPAISQPLSEVVEHGMAKDREKRPDMRSFRQSLYVHVEHHRSKAKSEGRVRLGAEDRPANTVPLARMATRVPQNSESRDILQRLIAPAKTKPMLASLRREHPAAIAPRRAFKRSKQTNILVIIAIVVTSCMTVAAVLRLRQRPPALILDSRREKPAHAAPILIPASATTVHESAPAQTLSAELNAGRKAMPSFLASHRNLTRRRKILQAEARSPAPPAATKSAPPTEHESPIASDGIFNEFEDGKNK
jgi:serine/threonine protein kinase